MFPKLIFFLKSLTKQDGYVFSGIPQTEPSLLGGNSFASSNFDLQKGNPWPEVIKFKERRRDS
jgi:hypothetical protein